jgi:hypothetical protein
LATKYSSGDEDKAYELLLLFQDSQDGLLRPYDPNVRMLGAENRENVTCWLDSVLFAMFARLSSFEPILYTNFEDEPRKQLSILIKLWVNMLRTGKLIDKEIVCSDAIELIWLPLNHVLDSKAARGTQELRLA